jgi:hypothetical protein
MYFDDCPVEGRAHRTLGVGRRSNATRQEQVRPSATFDMGEFDACSGRIGQLQCDKALCVILVLVFDRGVLRSSFYMRVKDTRDDDADADTENGDSEGAYQKLAVQSHDRISRAGNAAKARKCVFLEGARTRADVKGMMISSC